MTLRQEQRQINLAMQLSQRDIQNRQNQMMAAAAQYGGGNQNYMRTIRAQEMNDAQMARRIAQQE